MGFERGQPARISPGGWGGRFHQARIGTGLEVNEAATRAQLAGVRFRELVERYEAMPEAPDDPVERARAGFVLEGFGVDPAELGIAEAELFPPRGDADFN